MQPALFAVMVSLAKLWRACGVQPDAIAGHSQGEIAAAHVAGGLSLADAAQLVALRSRALTGLAGAGGMVSIALAVRDVEELVEHWGERISVAAVNGPSAVVVSGEREALAELLGECEAKGLRARQIPVDYAAHSTQVEAIRDELLEACSSIAPRSGDVPFYSTVTGGLLDTRELDGEYWYRNLRQTVCFAQVSRALLAQGCRMFVEVSPHPVLTVGLRETAEAALGGEETLGELEDFSAIGSLRREEGDAERFCRSLGEAWVGGAAVSWQAVFEGSQAQRVSLPTYAFQQQRYWIPAAKSGAGNIAAAGMDAAKHPLLGAALGLAGGEEWVFTGRLSLQTHPWLADHAMLGTALLPGTAFVELALRAGSQLGCERIQELTMEAPLALPETGGVQIQLSLGRPEESGSRSVGVYSRPDEGSSDGARGEQEVAWTCHATGVLAPADVAGASDVGDLAGADEVPGARDQAGADEVPGARDLAGADEVPGGQRQEVERRAALLADPAWPPADAEAIEVGDLYDRLAEEGYDYGPAFQGLRSAWRRGDHELLAEVALPEQQLAQAGLFDVHPALLDAALHVLAVDLLAQEPGGERRLLRPFTWSAVSVYATGASRLRVRLSLKDNDTVSLLAADESGAPVASVEALVLRPVSAEQLGGAHDRLQDSLLHLDWAAVAAEQSVPKDLVVLGVEDLGLVQALRAAGESPRVHADLSSLGQALDAGATLPATVLVGCAMDEPEIDGIGVTDALRRVADRVLGLAQAWLADERFSASRLVCVTQGALAVRAGEPVPGLADAPVWGLVRSALSENPGRFTLVDLDGEQSSLRALGTALDLDEPQLAVREGSIHLPRLVRMPSSTPGEDAVARIANGTTLITGGTGELGKLLARHLVTVHGVRSLLLASRRGPAADGALELEQELSALGAHVRIAACDVGDREQLRALLDTVEEEHPLSAVVHTAAVLADGVLESLTPERLDRVLEPKVDAAWHLHELTEHLDLPACLLFSSVSATLGSAGVGSYAAANAFLDALAQHRRARGLAATSMAWGQWGVGASGIAAELRGGRSDTDGALGCPGAALRGVP